MKRLLLMLVLLAPVWSAADEPRQQRAMRVDDLFEVQDLAGELGGPTTYSPDGRQVAFAWTRPKRELQDFSFVSPWQNADRDVWLQPAPGAAAINLTHGAVDGTGWQGAVWSPSGRYLAMLSTRDGKGVLWSDETSVLWVWDAKTRRLRKVSDRRVDRYRAEDRGVVWVDDRRVVVVLRPERSTPQWPQFSEVQRTLIDGWSKTAQGREAASSAVDSGIQEDPRRRTQKQLVVMDTQTGHVKVLAERTNRQWELAPDRHWELAPNLRAVAHYRQTRPYAPTAAERFPENFGEGDWTIEVVDLDGNVLLSSAQTSEHVVPASLRWSSVSDEVVFLRHADSPDAPARLMRARLSSGTIEPVALGDLDPLPPARPMAALTWTARGDLLVLARSAASGTGDKPSRDDWWLIRRDGARVCLTQSMDHVPLELWPVKGADAYVGVAADELWRIRLDGQVTNLTSTFAPGVRRLAWPAKAGPLEPLEAPQRDRTYEQVIIATREPRQPFEYHTVDLTSDAIAPLAAPSADARLVAYRPQSGTVLFHESGRNGARLWRADRSMPKMQVLMETNAFLRAVAESEYRMISYRSLNGRELQAWILLPVGYAAGKRYPLLTWVYNGTVVQAEATRPSSTYLLGSNSAVNLQLATANGFAVLIPSMPLATQNGPDDPMLQLPDGVLPAVEKAVELGIADTERVFVAGLSFGGYSTYGLITQTNRFKAAISLAGISNLIHSYGVFSVPWRFTDHPNDFLGYFIGWSEAGQGRMGSPPWKDLGRYLRNSPLMYVDRVNTPLMMVFGDMDIGPMDDAENFFRSLYRQGKRAQLVRYWGEGHVLESPANIRDMWKRMIAWLDEFGDIQRDADGAVVFDGDRARSRARAQ